MSWTLRARSASLVGGEIITDFSATLVERWNLPDTLQVTGRRADLEAALLYPVGVTLSDDTGRRFAGIPTALTYRHGTCTITYASDLIRLWDRDVYPTPSQPITAQTTDVSAVRSGAAETVLLGFISDNLGPTALAARSLAAGLTVPTSAGRGGSISNLSARLDSLGRLVADIAEAAALRVRVLQVGTSLTVVVTACPDLTSTARYGTGDSGGPGLIADDWEYTVARPTVTAALVAGAGVGTARVFRERIDTASLAVWGRIEAVVDQRQTSNTAELDKAGDDALREGAQPVEVRATILDDPGQRLGTDVPPGALVALDLSPDRVVDRLREITTTLDVTSGQATARTQGLVGSADAGLTRDQKQFLAARKALRKVVRQ